MERIEPQGQGGPTQRVTAIQSQTLANRIFTSHVETVLGAPLPDYFKFGGDYAIFQFAIGWTKRNTESGRLTGPIASHLTHPDIGTDFDKLPQGVKNFIFGMSTFQVLVYARLSVAELQELKRAGEQGFTGQISVAEPLLSKVNEKHHLAWMLARDLARMNDLDITIRDHTAHKERSLLTPAEITSDNAQVQAYAVQLANMPNEQFDWLLVHVQG